MDGMENWDIALAIVAACLLAIAGLVGAALEVTRFIEDRRYGRKEARTDG